jgi:hypothetical protein
MRGSVLAALLVVVPAFARAQEGAPAALKAGTYSFAFSLPESGNGSAGVWRFFSDRTALGLTVSLQAADQDDGPFPTPRSAPRSASDPRSSITSRRIRALRPL